MCDRFGIDKKTFLNGNIATLLLRRPYLSLVIIVFSFYQMQFYNSAFGQERLAVVSEFTGDVKIQHEDQWIVVKKIGPRIMNSSIFEGDTLETDTGSSADVLYDDGSLLQIKEETSLSFKTGELSEEKKAESKKETLRSVKLVSGKIWCKITPGTTVLTEFETPTGVASVRGTEFAIVYKPPSSVVKSVATQ